MKAIFLLPVLLLLALGLSCRQEGTDGNTVTDESKAGVEVLKGVEILYSDSAFVRVRIKGPVMERYAENGNMRQVFPNGIEVEFMGPGEKVQSRMTAGYAIRLEQEERAILRDSVFFVSNARDTLRTEELIWDEDKEQVYTHKFVVIRRPGEKVFGQGMEADQGFRRWKILRPAGPIQVQPNKSKS